MAWTEPLAGGYRGRYRNPSNPKEKIKVLQPDGTPFPRKRAAQHAATEEESKARRSAAVDKGTSTQLASIKWGDWWDQMTEKRDFPSDTRRKEEHLVAAHIRPKWGDTPLNKITHDLVQAWVSDEELKIRPGMSPGYALRIYGVFRLSINQAVKKKVLDSSPCVEIELPKVPKKAKPYLDVETVEEIDLHPRFKDAVEFGLETGLRPGELSGLHACMLDLKGGFLIVKHVYVTRRKMIRDYPKDEDTRVVPLTPRAVEILDRALDGRELTGGCGIDHFEETCDSVIVFRPPRQALVINPEILGTAMRRTTRAAKKPTKSPYSIRRGFGTRAAHGGMDAFALGDIMGHSDPRITREYVQQAPDALRRLTAALSPAPSAPGAESGAITDQGSPSTTLIEPQPHAG